MARSFIVVLGMIFTALVFIACEPGKPDGDAGPWYVGSWGTQSEGLAGSRQVEVTISADRRVTMMTRLPGGPVESQRTGWVESDSQIRMDDGAVVGFRPVGNGLEMLDPTSGQRRVYQKVDFVVAGPGPGGPGSALQPGAPVRATSFDRGLVGHWEGVSQHRGPDTNLKLEINGDGSVDLHAREGGSSHSRKWSGYLADGGRQIVLYGAANLWVSRHHRRLQARDSRSGEVVEYTKTRD